MLQVRTSAQFVRHVGHNSPPLRLSRRIRDSWSPEAGGLGSRVATLAPSAGGPSSTPAWVTATGPGGAANSQHVRVADAGQAAAVEIGFATSVGSWIRHHGCWAPPRTLPIARRSWRPLHGRCSSCTRVPAGGCSSGAGRTTGATSPVPAIESAGGSPCRPSSIAPQLAICLTACRRSVRSPRPRQHAQRPTRWRRARSSPLATARRQRGTASPAPTGRPAAPPPARRRVIQASAETYPPRDSRIRVGRPCRLDFRAPAAGHDGRVRQRTRPTRAAEPLATGPVWVLDQSWRSNRAASSVAAGRPADRCADVSHDQSPRKARRVLPGGSRSARRRTRPLPAPARAC